MANLLAPVSHNNSTFIISSYSPFLNSPELVRGALLVSTGSCSVVDMKIRADTSIKEASESMYMLVMGNIQKISMSTERERNLINWLS